MDDSKKASQISSSNKEIGLSVDSPIDAKESLENVKSQILEAQSEARVSADFKSTVNQIGQSFQAGEEKKINPYEVLSYDTSGKITEASTWRAGLKEKGAKKLTQKAA
jgi:hypothetical protein